MKRAIIYSGGMDSTVLLHAFKQEVELAITFNYGQKHYRREFECAAHNTGALKIPHITVDLLNISKWLESNLLKDGGEIPDGHYAETNMKKTVVPFRNGIMLSIAAGIAESDGLNGLTIANHAGDHAIYPDCRPEFINGMAEAILKGTYTPILLTAPFAHMTKREIAFKGRDLGVDFRHTWSCYKGGDMHCGRCGTCVERIEALMGFDPTEYEDTEFALKALNQWENQ